MILTSSFEILTRKPKAFKK